MEAPPKDAPPKRKMLQKQQLLQVQPTLEELIEALREGSEQAEDQSALLAQAAIWLEEIGERFDLIEEPEEKS